MVKLIATDLDGTVYHKGKLHPLTIKAVKKAKEQNVEVVIATGRSIRGVKKIAKEFGLNDGKSYIIGYNGALIYQLNPDDSVNIIKQVFLPTDDIIAVFDLAKQCKITLYAYTEDEELAYVNRLLSPMIIFMKHRSKTKLIKFHKDKKNSHLRIYKFICYGNIKKMVEFRNEVQKLSLSTFAWSYVMRSKQNIEVSPQNIDKSSSLEEVAKTLKINQKQIVFFGDGENDLKTLEWAGIGYAMNHAKDHVKAVADIVLEDGTTDVVGKEILKILEKN